MSLINMQDGVVKSSLVSQIQGKGAEVAKADQAAQIPFGDELARQADEVVLHTAKVENEAIRDDEERGQPDDRERKRREKGDDDDQKAEETPAEDADSSHHIDITV